MNKEQGLMGFGKWRQGKLAEAKAQNPWARFGWVMASVWLIFLFYPVSSLLNTDAPETWVVLGWVGTAVFAVVYLFMFVLGLSRGVAGSGGNSAVQYTLLGVLVVSVLVTVPAVGANATSFFPFLVAVLAYQFTRPLYWVGSALCVGIVVAIVFLAPHGTDYLGLLGILVIMVLVNAVSTWLILRSIAADGLALELATSEEREAVARDVHDLIGHSLTVVKLKSQLARRLMESDPDRARAELEDIERITAEAIQGVRATVTGLRAEGLAAQIDSARATLASAGIELDVTGDASALSPAQALPAGWIVREAVTNVLRHSEATRVRVTLGPGTLAVEDNGVGLHAKPGNGLRGMAERASMSGASCAVGVSELGGAAVKVTW